MNSPLALIGLVGIGGALAFLMSKSGATCEGPAFTDSKSWTEAQLDTTLRGSGAQVRQHTIGRYTYYAIAPAPTAAGGMRLSWLIYVRCADCKYRQAYGLTSGLEANPFLAPLPADVMAGAVQILKDMQETGGIRM